MQGLTRRRLERLANHQGRRQEVIRNKVAFGASHDFYLVRYAGAKGVTPRLTSRIG